MEANDCVKNNVNVNRIVIMNPSDNDYKDNKKWTKTRYHHGYHRNQLQEIFDFNNDDKILIDCGFHFFQTIIKVVII